MTEPETRRVGVVMSGVTGRILSVRGEFGYWVFPFDFLEGAKGVQLAELGLQSWREERKLEVPELTL